MHSAAVRQHSSNSNIEIVHNSIEHSLWNPPDFSSDDVLSCLWIVFTNSVMKWVCPMGSYVWGIHVFSSVRGMRCHLITRTEHLNTSGITSHGTESFHVKTITPSHPIPKISTRLTIFLVVTWKTEFVKTIHRQERAHHQKRNHMDSTRNAQ